MKQPLSFLLVIALSLLGLPFVYATETQEYYTQRVEQKIQQCERKAGVLNSGGTFGKEMGRTALEQAEFYKVNQDRLVQEMLDRNVEGKDHRVNVFLIKAFRETQSKGANLWKIQPQYPR
jgi:hypothetical protein